MRLLIVAGYGHSWHAAPGACKIPLQHPGKLLPDTCKVYGTLARIAAPGLRENG
ncbi:MAG: hypothetical protein KKA54_09170 [Proteobacteria bacterium]|nr:hypothetical protein [Pseudomonadota bacterium]MBU0966539.1 hypothetical protein [Pseudomonadota bacterium]